MKQHGIGVGYRYPPEFEGSDVDQQYLPDALADRRYFEASNAGYEGTIGARMDSPARGSSGRHQASAQTACRIPRPPIR